MLCLNNNYSSSSCHWKKKKPQQNKKQMLNRIFYKDQCICSKSTASPRFVSVSNRLMITAMAASSLLRLLRPGPTTLSKSSWEFSPEDMWTARERDEEDKLAAYMETVNILHWNTHWCFLFRERGSLWLVLRAGSSWHLLRGLSIWHLQTRSNN